VYWKQDKGAKFDALLDPAVAARRATARAAAAAERKGLTPGPGDYEVAEAEKIIRKATPNSIPFDRLHADAAAKKLTPQLQRKKYWEEKAQDLRQEHDDLREASDALTRPRVPTVRIVNPGKDSRGLVDDIDIDDIVPLPRTRRVWVERKAQEEEFARGGVGQYDVNYSAVERRPLVTAMISTFAIQ